MIDELLPTSSDDTVNSEVDPWTPTAEACQFGHWLFAQECLFMRGVEALNQLPDADLPEIAIAGRSNVGKSSLINALTNRNTLARTSHTPGRTQQLNFFELGKRLTLVDMPGYGYAKVSKKRQAEWRVLILTYLRGRPTLNRIYLLIDGRHGLKDADIDMMELLDEAAVCYQIVLTKSDKVPKAEMDQRIQDVEAALMRHAAAYPRVRITSAHDKKGLTDLRADMASFSQAIS